MKKIIKKIKVRHIKQVLIYGLVGVAALVTQLVSYLFLCKLNMYPLYANFTGGVLGVLVGYKGHTKYTFERTHKFSHQEFIKYIITAIIGILINSLGVYILVNVLKYSSSVAVLPMLATPGITFIINKFWAFK
ncbi:MAG: GtrA family protein [Proteobacteria bacterium]|jgi:putative flippase GtrA|nr:GtrA family protein [Pseudomonadota bacterium]